MEIVFHLWVVIEGRNCEGRRLGVATDCRLMNAVTGCEVKACKQSQLATYILKEKKYDQYVINSGGW